MFKRMQNFIQSLELGNKLTLKNCLTLLAIICILIIIIKCSFDLIRWKLSYQAYLRYESSKLNIVLNTDKNIIPNIQYNVIFFYSHNYKKTPDYFDVGYQILNTYCTKHNYKLLIMDHSNDTELISPYWLRVKDLVTLSQQYPESNNIFIYLDLDTCLNPKYMNVSVNQLINRIDYLNHKSWDMYVGTECTVPMNTGGLIVKNTDWSKQLLQLWWEKYSLSEWSYNNNKWTCHTNKSKPCDWARDGYEQGELNNIYANNELDSKNHLLIVNSSIISNDLIELDSFIYHFYGSKNRMPLYNKLYKDFLLVNQTN